MKKGNRIGGLTLRLMSNYETPFNIMQVLRMRKVGERAVYAGGKRFASRNRLCPSKGKYPSIFSRQMGAIVFMILQIFFSTRGLLKIGEYPGDIPQLQLGNIHSREAFRPIARERNVRS